MMRRPVTLLLFFASLAAILSFTGKKPGFPGGRQKAVLGTIVIDAGHGGPARGAKGLFSYEADVALAISLKLGQRAQEAFPEIRVVYTRTSDTVFGVHVDARTANRMRAELANEVKGDLFLSIHCNATPQKAGGWYAKRVVGHTTKTVTVGKGAKKRKKTMRVPVYENYWVKNERHGTETYIWAADRSGVKSTYINLEESGEFAEDSTSPATPPPDMNSPEAKIRAQLYEKKYFGKSLMLANMVEEEFAKGGRASGGVKQRNWEQIWVLQATGMPSILVETGFITNEEEEKYLNSEEGQSEIVESIITALKKYKETLEGSNTTTTAKPEVDTTKARGF
ncbi:N-acetylmuramoyl-L-alanine amidase [Paraflavitalea soli]|uniref:N-acetylmuramoyl-L-alanine amidase n=1 Tax=Paraflavitalea soli TaxID=2315862 RepID=A0A3B7N2G6_9BACT|nr:N-acetylmuramoyl-L-alanine amidase [Paraflavitalea soli]AXY78245.1 N-acetylmuramoyl-L-alanine amidase [Paraflavitalea soli]